MNQLHACDLRFHWVLKEGGVILCLEIKMAPTFIRGWRVLKSHALFRPCFKSWVLSKKRMACYSKTRIVPTMFQNMGIGGGIKEAKPHSHSIKLHVRNLHKKAVLLNSTPILIYNIIALGC